MDQNDANFYDIRLMLCIEQQHKFYVNSNEQNVHDFSDIFGKRFLQKF